MSKCKKGRNRKCSRKKRKKSYKRNYVTRTTCCKGGCVPSTQDALASTTFPGCGGGTFTRDGRGNLMGCGTTTLSAPNCGVGVPTCGVGVPTHGVGVPTYGVGAGSIESQAHLHVDRCGIVYVDNHCGGDRPHSHDPEGLDHYAGRVSDPRTLIRDPDALNADVLGSSSTKACGTSGDCAADEFCGGGTCLKGAICQTDGTCSSTFSCQGGFCKPMGDNGVRNAPRPTNLGCSTTSRACDPGRTTSTFLSTARPCNGDLVAGSRDPAGCGSINCSSCRFTSASLCDGSTLSHCNLACAAPGNANTRPPSSLNTRQQLHDLRGANNNGLSCIQGALCGSKRPTICKSKIKEVYCC